MVKNLAVLVSFSFLMVSCISDRYKEVPKVDLSQLPQNTSEVLPKALEVEGTIPIWLKGTLIRNGPGILKDKDSYVKHWFDGLGKLEAFSINDCKVVYSCRFIQSDTYKAYKKTGKFDFNGFAQKASSSQFSIIDFLLGYKNETINNANVNVAEINQRFVALTEVPLPVEFDKDLNTVSYFDYNDNLPKNFTYESAHVLKDPITNEIWNFLIKIGLFNTSYQIYHIPQNSAERNLLTTIPVSSASYMHSFSLAGNYIVLLDYPLRSNNPKDLGSQFIQSFAWQMNQPTRCYVIDRRTGDYHMHEIDPLFSFHHVNGFENDNNIYVDFIAYPNSDIVWGVNKYPAVKDEYPNKLMRLEINPKNNTTKLIPLYTQSIEFPRINDSLIAQNYRYLYAVHFTNKGSGLIKFDHYKSKHLYWSKAGFEASEPIFIPKPHSSLEDDGVILSIINNLTTKESFLLVLNAIDFKELARVKAPHLIPFGFHGKFFQ